MISRNAVVIALFVLGETDEEASSIAETVRGESEFEKIGYKVFEDQKPMVEVGEKEFRQVSTIAPQK